MRSFIGILLSVMGIAAIAAALFGFGVVLPTLWMVAQIVSGAIMIVGGIMLVRGTETEIVEATVDDYDNDSMFLP